MIRRQRQIHRWVWTGYAVGIPLILLVALSYRADRPIEEQRFGHQPLPGLSPPAEEGAP